MTSMFCSTFINSGVQYKYSDEAWKIKEMVQKHVDHHGNTKFDPVTGLDGDQIQIIGPRDVTGKAKRIKGEVTLDEELSVQAPTTDEIEQFLEVNHDKFSGKNLNNVKKLQDSLTEWKKNKAGMDKQLQTVRIFDLHTLYICILMKVSFF